MELSFEELKSRIDLGKVPEHVAIIMDGNGRWARLQNQDRIFGHLNGVESVREALVSARELGIKHLTLYAFSSENWSRPQEEVAALMGLLVETIYKEIGELHANGVRLNAIGDLSQLPGNCMEVLNKAMDQTRDNTEVVLSLALSYGGRWEIIKAAEAWAKSGSQEPLTEEHFRSFLPSSNIPDPDLMIRTSGEQRISNFLLWQCAYTEFIFTPTLWPDFRKRDFYDAIYQYQNRERRFGKTSEQIQP